MHGKPLVDREYLLEKMDCKASWTYTVIPEIAPDPHTPFGFVRVRGTIDGVPISNYHLMPGEKGSGVVFLSVKADLRRKIKKGAGDTIHVTLWRDDNPPEVPGELRLCIEGDPAAAEFFDSLTESQRQAYVRWVYSAKTEKTKIERMAKSVAALAERRKFADRQA